MFVHMWMTEDAVTIGPATPLSRAAELMARLRFRRLPVVEPSATGPKLIGIISASDVLQAFPPDLNPFSVVARDTMEGRAQQEGVSVETVGDVMHRSPLTTTHDAPLERAAKLMRDNKIGALPVLRHGRLAGIVTESDIFRAFVGMLDAPAGSARVAFDLAAGEDPFPLVAALTGQHGLTVHSFNTHGHGGRTICVVQVVGPGTGVDALLEAVWESHHRVLQVLKAD